MQAMDRPFVAGASASKSPHSGSLPTGLPPTVLTLYPAATDRHDELNDASGQLRPSWQTVLGHLGNDSGEALRRRCEVINQQILENGVTYNVYADPKGADRPWELDLLPQLIEGDEWQALAAGIAERAGLLNRVLADLYGPQQLLKQGLLPPELVFGHSNFLWPALGAVPPGDVHLHIYAADLARGPDGRWWVLADRTQTPSGAGYALENRTIIARALSEPYRELSVQRMDGYFSLLRDNLLRLAADGDGPPLLVLLTPGANNETYFEHVYLARELGIPLVEGHDLTVRGATVYLKTLGGLERVHAILRRVDGDWCDPLELRADSALGVPGLLEAARAGRVLIANSLGAGVLESPGLMGFLPKIAERMLGHPLSLPSVASWWCGEAPVLRDALRKLPQLIIKPAFPSQRFQAVIGSQLDRVGIRRLRARIRRRPYAYVAQEMVRPSQAPVLQTEPSFALEPRAIGMRVYAVATAQGYQVLPGALSRVAASASALAVSMQRGGRSKDTWVLGERSIAVEPAPSRRIDAVVRRDRYLLSRTVENLYWLGRYCERCDGHARLLRSLLQRENASDAPVLGVGVGVAQQLRLLPERDSVEAALLAGLCDRRWSGSLSADLGRLAWSAAQVRARISSENWRAVVELQREVERLESEATPTRAQAFLNHLLIALTAMSGFALDDMTRDEGWRFLMVGRSVERLQLQAIVLAHAAGNPAADPALLGWLLELANSTITYRSRYLAAPQWRPVLDLILLDEDNPHALVFQLPRLVSSLELLDCEADAINPVRALEADLRALDLSLMELDSAPLLQLFERADQAMRGLSEYLLQRFFAHVETVGRITYSA